MAGARGNRNEAALWPLRGDDLDAHLAADRLPRDRGGVLGDHPPAAPADRTHDRARRDGADLPRLALAVLAGRWARPALELRFCQPDEGLEDIRAQRLGVGDQRRTRAF